MRNRLQGRGNAGFTLMEVMIAIIVLTVGILSLAVALADGLAYLNAMQFDYIAQQKASEAVESIFTARDMGQATWSTICNAGSPVCANGIFVAGPTALCDPGPDGIVGTADDFNGTNCAVQADGILMPSGNTINNVTNTRIPLSDYNFKRTIDIENIVVGGNTLNNIRSITVTITYSAGRFNRKYVLVTNISNFS